MTEEKKVFKDSRTAVQRLQGFIGLLPDEPLFATPPIYKEVYPDDPTKWPKFKFRPTDGLEFNQDVDDESLYKIVEGRAIAIQGRFRMLRMKRGLLDWTNLKDQFGRDIPCPKDADGRITDDAIRAMKPDLQEWVLGVISDASGVTKEESDGLKF